MEIMLNQGQFEEGVEQKARQRLKRIPLLAFKWARECGIKMSREKKKKKQEREKAHSFSAMADTFFCLLKQMLRQMVVN